MNASEDCIAAIKEFEGFRGQAYQDIAGVWTCGYGYTIGVGPTTTMTEFAADHFLRLRLGQIAASITKLLHVAVNQSQFDALESFAYNVGVNALADSTLLKKLNAGDIAGASAEFPRWCHVGEQKIKDLENRRLDEQAWFNGTSPVKAFIHV